MIKDASFIALLFLQEQIKRANFLVSALVDSDINSQASCFSDVVTCKLVEVNNILDSLLKALNEMPQTSGD